MDGRICFEYSYTNTPGGPQASMLGPVLFTTDACVSVGEGQAEQTELRTAGFES